MLLSRKVQQHSQAGEDEANAVKRRTVNEMIQQTEQCGRFTQREGHNIGGLHHVDLLKRVGLGKYSLLY